MAYKFTIYKDAAKEYRWNFKSSGKIMGDSGEGYASKYNCERAIRTFRAGVESATVEDATGEQ